MTNTLFVAHFLSNITMSFVTFDKKRSYFSTSPGQTILVV